MANLYSAGKGGYSASNYRATRPSSGDFDNKRVEVKDMRGVNYVDPDVIVGESSIIRFTFGYNFRLGGETEKRQRSPVVSRDGSLLISDPIGVIDNGITLNNPLPRAVQISYTDVKASRLIFDGKLTGINFIARNRDRCTGYIRIDAYDVVECIDGDGSFNLGGIKFSTTVDLEGVNVNNFGEVKATFNQCLEGDYIFTFRIFDNFDVDECGNAVPKEDCFVELATIDGSHLTSQFDVPIGACGVTQTPTFETGLGAIHITPITTECEGGIGEIFYCCDGVNYSLSVFPCLGRTVMYRTNLETGAVKEMYDGISTDSDYVSFVQVGGEIWFVDGHTQGIKMFDCETLEVLPVVSPDGQGIGTASIIELHNDRVYVNDVDLPNLMRYSMISSSGRQPHVFESLSFFNVPNESQVKTACSPIRSFGSFNSELFFFTEDENFVFNDAGIISSQEVLIEELYGNTGVSHHRNVDYNGRNVIVYFSKGNVYYTAGHNSRRISRRIKPELERIKPENFEKVHVRWHDEKVRVYYPRGDSKYNNYMAMYYFAFESDAHLGEWVNDTDTFVSGTLIDPKTDELYEVSSCMAVISKAEAAGNNMGSPIKFRAHTAYISFDSSFSEKRIKAIKALISGVEAYTVDIGYRFEEQTPRYERKFFQPTFTEAEIDEDDTIEGNNFAGDLVKEFNVRPSGRGKRFQTRIRADVLNSKLELQAMAWLWDSSDVR